MRFDIYYLVKPNESLVDKLRHDAVVDPFTAMNILGESQLWIRTVYDRERRHILLSQLKLIFLAEFHSVYVEKAEYPDLRDLAKDVLGHPPYTLATFDTWWNVEVFLFQPEEYSANEEGISLTTLSLLSNMNDPYLDKWLQGLILAKNINTSDVPDNKP